MIRFEGKLFPPLQNSEVRDTGTRLIAIQLSPFTDQGTMERLI